MGPGFESQRDHRNINKIFKSSQIKLFEGFFVFKPTQNILNYSHLPRANREQFFTKVSISKSALDWTGKNLIIKMFNE